jgi:opacity protein-like surface antigen
MKIKFIAQTLITSLSLLALLTPQQASAQIIPQPWVSVGGKDGETTYAVGAKAFDVGIEVGSGPKGSAGVDVLKFISLPVISPYVGVGYYSEDKGVALSGGVQVGATKNVFVGAGYNSVRGFNGQLGIKF